MVDSTAPGVPKDPDVALAEHVNLLRRRCEIHEAETVASDGLQRFPGSVDVVISFGRILLAAYKYEDAAKVFSQAGAVLNDDRLSAWRIAALSRMRAYDEARSVGVDALEKFSNSSLIRVTLGRTYLDSSRPREALRHFSEASAVAPEDWHALAWHAIGLGKLSQWEEAEKLAHELVSRHPEIARSHYTLGRILLDADDPPRALPHFDKALDLEPNFIKAIQWRVEALCELRRYSEAKEFSINTLKLFPRCPALHVEQGLLFSAQDREDEAVAAAERALAIDPRHSTALRSHIIFLCYARRFEEAEQAAREAIERRPDDPDVHGTVAWLKSKLDCYEEAVAAAQRALAIDPRHSWALRSHIHFLRYARRFDEAEQAAHEALERRPDDPDVHVTVAWLKSELDCYEEAVAAVERALVIDPRHSAALCRRIDLLRSARRFEEAEQAAHDALERRPDDPDVHITTAGVQSDLGHYDEAVAAAERALAIDPRHSTALRSRITFLNSTRRFEEAEQAARDALERRPKDPDVHVTVAWLKSELDCYEEAVAAAQRALVIDSRHSWALRSRINFLCYARRFDEAEQAAHEALERRPDDPDVHVTVAWLKSELDCYEEAVAAVERALVIDPRHSAALCRRIDLLRSARRFEEAEQAAHDALERRPDDPDVHITRAWVFSFQDREDEAVAAAERALAIDPRHSWALRSHIDFLRDARRFEEAEQAAHDALERWPDDPDVHITTAWLFSFQNREDEAVVTAERALAIDPRHSWALRSHISFLCYARRFEEAEQAAREAIERRPKDPELHITRAWVFSFQDRENEAVAAAERALVIDPRHSWALRSHITFLRDARRFDEAEQAAHDALERRPDDPDVHITTAGVKSDLGHYDEAVAAAKLALAIDPRHSTALRNHITFLRDARRFDEAEQAAHDAIEHRPKDPDVHITVAWLKSELDCYEEAVAAAKRALAIDPQHSWALRSHIHFLRYARRFEEAEQAAREAIERRPNDPENHVELGRMHDYFLKFNTAVDCFTEALRREPAHTNLNLALSVALRSLRRFNEAERQITRLCHLRPHVLDLKAELGWIHHNEGRLSEARRLFEQLLDSSVNDQERAAAHHALGWVAFSEEDYGRAEDQFRMANTNRPDDFDYMLSMAWTLARQEGQTRLREAEQIAFGLLDRRADSSVHICLGVLAFKQENLASAEYHLKKSLEVDPNHGSYTDLGALYLQMGRYEEAVEILKKAIVRDQYDTNAHIELGATYLQVGGERTSDAEREFRQALAIDHSSGAAAIGLAQALSKAGDEVEAAENLRRVLVRQNSRQRWRSHLALARLLIQRGDKQQNSEFYAEAYTQAQRAIGSAPDVEADPHFVAGVAHHRMGSLTADTRGRLGFRRRAAHHLRECLLRDPSHAEAHRNLHLLERELKSTTPVVMGGYAVAVVSFSLLSLMWIMFFFSNKVTALMLTTTTPVLVGMFLIAMLLPALISLKLPGFEAHLQAGVEEISPGPTGQITFDPGRFTVTAGPSGQLPRHE